MKTQLKGGSLIDWDREISTAITNTNNFFLELYIKVWLSKENYVNWDPVDQTVLANNK